MHKISIIKILKGKIKDDNKRWKELPCSIIVRIKIVEKFILSNIIYKFNVILIKIPVRFSAETEKMTLISLG